MAPDSVSNRPQKLTLPLLVVSRADVIRLLRELNALSDFLSQAAIRTPGTGVKLPRTSRLLDELASGNNLNLLQPTDLDTLLEFLTKLRDHAPGLHMSFSADPSAVFTNKLITWLRKEIHPNLLLQIGLQPTLAAGCVVRTPNRYLDLSLRRHFTSKRALLIEKIGAL